MKRHGVKAAALAGALVLTTGAAHAAEVTLRAVTSFAENTAGSFNFEKFVKKVNDDGKGLVQINYIGGPKAMPPFEVGNAVRNGVVDIANVTGAYYTNIMPESDALKLAQMTAPELRKNGAYDYINSVWNQKMNVQYLGKSWEITPFHLYLNKKIDKPDLTGLKLRITPVYRDFFQALGATVMQTPPGEVYTALERGVVDGYGWPIQGIFDFGWHEKTKYRVDPGFYNVEVSVLVNLNTWKRLDDKQREFLNRQAVWMETLDSETIARNEADRKRQAESGIEIIKFEGDGRKAVPRQGLPGRLGQHHRQKPGARPEAEAAAEQVRRDRKSNRGGRGGSQRAQRHECVAALRAAFFLLCDLCACSAFSAVFPTMTSLDRLYRVLIHACGDVAALLFGIVAVLVTLDVVMRNLGFGNLPWIVEVSEYSLPVATFLTAPWLLHNNQHVRVEMLLTAVPARIARWLDQFADLIGLAGSLGLVWYGLRIIADSRSIDALIIKTLVFPEWWLFAPLPIGGGAARHRIRAPHAAPRHGGRVMSWQLALLLLFGVLSALMAVGVPVAFAFIAVNIVGAILFLGGDAGLMQLARNAVASVTSFSLTPIPFFVLMGEILFHTGLAMKAIEAIELLIRRVPGRLAVVAVVAGTIFSAISGSTIATTAMLGSLMLPEMLRRGYDPNLAMGPIMAIGGVDMLIPPSALTVLLGSLAGISISQLLIAGIVPGLLLSVAFVGYIVLSATLRPGPGARTTTSSPCPAGRAGGRWSSTCCRCSSSSRVVIGAMSAGWATPTESAALGAVATMAAGRGLPRADLARR